ncbi:hypothetical protein HDU97_009636 [Phlyctochytrium planicorne]|nr:hypothetical protein HDU97_009636 [Phlyctochytrium planicorne]
MIGGDEMELSAPEGDSDVRNAELPDQRLDSNASSSTLSDTDKTNHHTADIHHPTATSPLTSNSKSPESPKEAPALMDTDNPLSDQMSDPSKHAADNVTVKSQTRWRKKLVLSDDDDDDDDDDVNAGSNEQNVAEEKGSDPAPAHSKDDSQTNSDDERMASDSEIQPKRKGKLHRMRSRKIESEPLSDQEAETAEQQHVSNDEDEPMPSAAEDRRAKLLKLAQARASKNEVTPSEDEDDANRHSEEEKAGEDAAKKKSKRRKHRESDVKRKPKVLPHTQMAQEMNNSGKISALLRQYITEEELQKAKEAEEEERKRLAEKFKDDADVAGDNGNEKEGDKDADDEESKLFSSDDEEDKESKLFSSDDDDEDAGKGKKDGKDFAQIKKEVVAQMEKEKKKKSVPNSDNDDSETEEKKRHEQEMLRRKAELKKKKQKQKGASKKELLDMQKEKERLLRGNHVELASRKSTLTMDSLFAKQDEVPKESNASTDNGAPQDAFTDATAAEKKNTPEAMVEGAQDSSDDRAATAEAGVIVKVEGQKHVSVKAEAETPEEKKRRELEAIQQKLKSLTTVVVDDDDDIVILDEEESKPKHARPPPIVAPALSAKELWMLQMRKKAELQNKERREKEIAEAERAAEEKRKRKELRKAKREEERKALEEQEAEAKAQATGVEGVKEIGGGEEGAGDNDEIELEIEDGEDTGKTRSSSVDIDNVKNKENMPEEPYNPAALARNLSNLSSPRMPLEEIFPESVDMDDTAPMPPLTPPHLADFMESAMPIDGDGNPESTWPDTIPVTGKRMPDEGDDVEERRVRQKTDDERDDEDGDYDVKLDEEGFAITSTKLDLNFSFADSQDSIFPDSPMPATEPKSFQASTTILPFVSKGPAAAPSTQKKKKIGILERMFKKAEERKSKMTEEDGGTETEPTVPKSILSEMKDQAPKSAGFGEGAFGDSQDILGLLSGQFPETQPIEKVSNEEQEAEAEKSEDEPAPYRRVIEESDSDEDSNDVEDDDAEGKAKLLEKIREMTFGPNALVDPEVLRLQEEAEAAAAADDEGGDDELSGSSDGDASDDDDENNDSDIELDRKLSMAFSNKPTQDDEEEDAPVFYKKKVLKKKKIRLPKSAFVENEAEEEEDEFMGLGGVDGEDFDSSDSELICSGDEEQIDDFADIQDLHRQRGLEEDTKLVESLLNDVTSGNLRRRLAGRSEANKGFTLSDSDDEEMLLRAMRRNFAPRRDDDDPNQAPLDRYAGQDETAAFAKCFDGSLRNDKCLSSDEEEEVTFSSVRASLSKQGSHLMSMSISRSMSSSSSIDSLPLVDSLRQMGATQGTLSKLTKTMSNLDDSGPSSILSREDSFMSESLSLTSIASLPADFQKPPLMPSNKQSTTTSGSRLPVSRIARKLHAMRSNSPDRQKALQAKIRALEGNSRITNIPVANATVKVRKPVWGFLVGEAAVREHSSKKEAAEAAEAAAARAAVRKGSKVVKDGGMRKTKAKGMVGGPGSSKGLMKLVTKQNSFQ